MPKLARPKLSRIQLETFREEGLQHIDDSMSAFITLLARVTTTSSFYRGQQHGTLGIRGYQPKTRRFYEKDEVRNYTRAFVRSTVANLLRNLPNPQVVASHADADAMEAANLSTLLATSFLRNGVITFDTLYRAALAANIHGGAWLKVSWDDREGRVVGYEDSNGETDMFGHPIDKPIREGEICVEAVNMTQALPDPAARRARDMRYIVHLKRIPLATARQMYPEDVTGREIVWEPNTDMNNGARDALDYTDPWESQVYTGSTGMENQEVEIPMLHERSNDTFPNGRMMAFHGKQLLHIDAQPRFPFRLVNGFNIVEDQLYADGVVTDLVSPQRAVNRVASSQNTMLKKSVRPWLLEPRGAKLKMAELGGIGSIVTYNYGYKPSYIEHPPIDQSTFSFQDATVGQMKDVSMQSDVSRGDIPPGISSGRALAYIAEFERAAHSPEIHMWKETIADVLRMCLHEAHANYQEGRLIQMLGHDMLPSVRAFANEDFDFNHHLQIEPFSGAPDSRALRMSEQMEAFQVGAFEDTPAAEKFRRMSGWDHSGVGTVDDQAAGRNHARQENVAYLTDPLGLPRAEFYEEHDAHLDEHIRFVNSGKFRQLPEWAREYMLAHIESHEVFRGMQLPVMAEEESMLTGQYESPQGEPPPEKPPGIESPADGGHDQNINPVPEMDEQSGYRAA